MINIRKLEAELWESADLLRQGSKLTSSQYCMPVLALLFLRYAYSRYKMVEAEILQSRPMRGGRVMPVELLDKIKKELAGMDHPFDKPNTKATIIITIRDVLYQELPESYPDESITHYRDKVYNYICQHYGSVA